MRLAALTATALALVLAATACASTPAEHARRVVTLARHLDNPRGIAHAPDGSIYIAEAGHSGANCGSLNCFGFTGAVARYRSGHLTRLARGLFSTANAVPRGKDVLGIDAVSVGAGGTVYGIIGSTPGLDPRQHTAAVEGQRTRTVAFTRGRRAFGPALEPFENAHNPDGKHEESDPYGIVAHRGALYVADAGANDLLRVRGRSVSLVAAFPAVKGSDSVPTCVAVGPDGALYVGEFASYRPGLARVWRVVPGHRPRVYRDGFSDITGLAFGPRGALYVTEGSTGYDFGTAAGDVVRVTRSGQRTRFGTSRLRAPAGAWVDRSGRIYVANHSVTPRARGGGELVRITP